MDYEYRVIPAPKRLKKIKGVSDTPDLFARTLTDCINTEARNGWEYVRSEALAAREPDGWLRRGALVEETMLVFRRPRRADRVAAEPEARIAGPVREAPAPAALRGRPVPAEEEARSAEPRHEHHPARQLRPGPQTTVPPLLRPVPRHTPGEKG